MEYTTLGETGMKVSRICLGCLSFGSTDWQDWVLEAEESTALIERAIDLGINFFDTANAYSLGESERILGEALAGYERDQWVIATKGYYQLDRTPNTGGLSRKALDTQLAGSRERLGIDTVDVYQIHRWDHATPIERTLQSLDDAVRRGKVRYIGASSMGVHQFAEALHASERLGLERFATMQNHYNLAYREEEREMLPLTEREGIGVIPWSPLARGYLARPHEDADATTRGVDTYRSRYRDGGGPEINARVRELAQENGVTMAQIALSWLLHKGTVDAPIVGTTSVEHLEEAVEALDIDLSSNDIAYLEEPYEPLEVTGHGYRPTDRHLQ